MLDAFVLYVVVFTLYTFISSLPTVGQIVLLSHCDLQKAPICSLKVNFRVLTLKLDVV